MTIGMPFVLENALSLMVDAGVDAAAVVDDEGRRRGVVTISDLAALLK